MRTAGIIFVALALSGCGRSWQQESWCLVYEWQAAIVATEAIGSDIQAAEGLAGDIANLLHVAATNRTTALLLDNPPDKEEIRGAVDALPQVGDDRTISFNTLKARVVGLEDALEEQQLPRAAPKSCDLTADKLLR